MRGGAAGYLAYQAALTMGGRPSRRSGGSPPIVPLRGDAIFDGPGQWPRSWEEMVGQEDAKYWLKTAVWSARWDTAKWVEAVGGREVALELLDSGDWQHVDTGGLAPRKTPDILLRIGKAGMGKTALAKLIGAECGSDYVELSGPLVDADIAEALQQIDHFGVLFWDEIHRAGETRSRGQVLLTYMEGGQLFVGGHQVPVSPFITIVGATTEAQRLGGALLQRFLKPHLDAHYTDPQARPIARQLAGKIAYDTGVPMPTDEQFFVQVARAANNTPRLMRDILAVTRDIANTSGNANWNPTTGSYDLTGSLRLVGVRPDGLTRHACQYLQTLFDLGGRAGREAIANVMEEPAGLADVERLLIDKGLIRPNPSGRGRELTDAGLQYVEQLLLELSW
jgi:Holliday junction resolvasome RuvABC ATP-dependent DNA helicase subunit